MKYISLFSGIGGFELGIQRALGNQAECIGFSEIDKFALRVYQNHFPTHKNLGDITKITEEDIKRVVEGAGGCDMVVGGFPCTNLTSMANFKYGNSDGLAGPASGLFWNMLNVIRWVRKYNGSRVLHIIIENNASMKKSNKDIITTQLQTCLDVPVKRTPLNGADFGVQTRRRLFWTTFDIDVSKITCEQTWDDVLLPIEEVADDFLPPCLLKHGNDTMYAAGRSSVISIQNVRGRIYEFIKTASTNESCIWFKGYHSDTGNTNLPYPYPIGKSRTMLRGRDISHALIDRRVSCDGHEFFPRRFNPVEVERLFWFPDGWVTSSCSASRSCMLLGNSVVVKVIEFIVKVSIGQL